MRPGAHPREERNKAPCSSARGQLPCPHSAGPYVSAAQVLERKASSAVVLQAHLRGWLARRRVAEMREARRALGEFTAAQQAQRQQQEEEQRAAEIWRRMQVGGARPAPWLVRLRHSCCAGALQQAGNNRGAGPSTALLALQPQTAADFAILHRELEAWWGQEVARIKGSDAEGADKQEAMQQLLAKVGGRARGGAKLSGHEADKGSGSGLSEGCVVITDLNTVVYSGLCRRRGCCRPWTSSRERWPAPSVWRATCSGSWRPSSGRWPTGGWWMCRRLARSGAWVR